MPKLRKRVVFLMLSLLAASGCAGVQSYRANQFETRARELVRAIRWGEYERAVAFLARIILAPGKRPVGG